MKRKMAVLVILFFAYGVMSAELELENGSFEKWEEGLPVNWSTSVKGVISQDNSQVYDGKSSLLINLIPKCKSVTIVHEGKQPVDSKKIYQITFFYKIHRKEGSNCNLWLSIRNHLKTGEVKDAQILKVWTKETLSEWGQKLVSFIPEPNADKISVIFSASGLGSFWIDKVSLKEVGKIESRKIKPKELLSNPGFESYGENDKLEVKSTPWILNSAYPAKVTIMVDLEKSHSGEKFLKVEQETEREGAIWHKGIQVDLQKKYRFSVWAKGRGSLILLVYQSGHGGFLFSEVVGKFKLTEDWKQYSGIYRPSSSAVTSAAAALHIIGEGYFDDVSFQEVE